MNKLISIPISHFSEKARWGLEYCGVAYREVFHIQIFSWFPALWSTRFKSRFLPVLVTVQGIYTDSSDILRYADSLASEDRKIFPSDPALLNEVEKWVSDLSDLFAPATRLWCYCQLFRHKEIIHKYNPHKVFFIEKIFLRLFLPFFIFMGRRVLSINIDTYNQSLKTIELFLKRVEDRLNQGHKFLVGGQLTAADLTFAAVMAPLIMPKDFGVPVPDINEFDSLTCKAMQNYRESKAGIFALEIYKNYRKDLQTYENQR